MSNEFDTSLFEPEVILPAQMTWGARSDGDTSRPRALMLAILEEAILCIERGRRRRHWQTHQLAAEAQQWVRSDSREWLFSFASICDVLGIDADALRDRLLTNVEHMADGGRAARAEADQPSGRSGSATGLLPQRQGRRVSIAVAGARAPARRTAGGQRSAAGFSVRAHVGGA